MPVDGIIIFPITTKITKGTERKNKKIFVPFVVSKNNTFADYEEKRPSISAKRSISSFRTISVTQRSMVSPNSG